MSVRKNKMTETYPDYLLVYRRVGREVGPAAGRIGLAHAKVSYLPLPRRQEQRRVRVEEIKQADGDVVEGEEDDMARQAAELVKSMSSFIKRINRARAKWNTSFNIFQHPSWEIIIQCQNIHNIV